jgi:hypothetical protein
VTVLADTAIRAKDLDGRRMAAKKAAEEAMQNKTSREEIVQAEAEPRARRDQAIARCATAPDGARSSVARLIAARRTPAAQAAGARVT